ncbi:MAG TPA: alpha/beta fold hydrolase [Propionibacterium sp.]|nr:alpha/beta fold hydrolase [Propionibacterium sp.]
MAEANPAIGKSIKTGDFNTNYLEAGEQNGGTPVILMHGSGPGVTAYANWRGIIPILAEQFHVLAPDMVGFGYSDRPEGIEFNCQVWADQTYAFMQAKGIEKAHLVGNSFGGSNAIRLTTDHPDAVDRLVLMGSMGVDFPIVEGEGLDIIWGYEPSVENMAQAIRTMAYGDELAQNENLAETRYKASIEPGFHEAFSAMFPAPRQRWVQSQITDADKIRGIKQETLVIHGREDQVIPLSTSYALHQMIDRADLQVFAHCGHWVQIEREADFALALINFFNRKEVA